MLRSPIPVSDVWNAALTFTNRWLTRDGGRQFCKVNGGLKTIFIVAVNLRVRKNRKGLLCIQTQHLLFFGHLGDSPSISLANITFFLLWTISISVEYDE